MKEGQPAEAMFPGYNPGTMPTYPPPSAGDSVSFEVDGYPPYKDEHFSIRNRRHPIHERFVKLRMASTAAMAGRKWYEGAVQIEFVLFAPELDHSLTEYAAGIEDALDGSHGETFTYLPVVFQDDCQVCTYHNRFVRSDNVHYEITVTFLN